MTLPSFRGHAPRALIGFCAAVLFALALPVRAQDSGKIDPATWAPNDAVAFIGVPDLDDMLAAMKKTTAWKMMQDPASKSLAELNVAHKIYDGVQARLGKALETEPDKLKNPFGGPLGVYVTAAVTDGKLVPSLTFVGTVKDAATMREYYDKAVKRFKQTADSHEAVSFGSLTIDHFKTKARADKDESGDSGHGKHAKDKDGDESDDPNDGGHDMTAIADQVVAEILSSEGLPESLALCLTDNRLIIAVTPDDVKGAVRREKGGDSLKDHDDYKAIGRQFKNVGQVRLMVNLQRVFELARADNKEAAAEMDTVLGAKCMRSVIGHIEWNGEKYDSRAEMLLMMSGERTGVAKIMSMKNGDVAPPSYVSTDLCTYFGVRLVAADVLEQVEKILRQTDPEAADEMRNSMEMDTPDGKKLDIRKDVIEQLAPPVCFGFGFATPYKSDSTRVMFALGTKGRDVFDRLVAIAQAAGAPLNEREIGGKKAYDLMFGISLGASADAIFAGSTAAVDAAVSGSGADKSLASDASFKKLAEFLPREAWGVVYMDTRKIFEAAIELAKHEDELQKQMFTNPLASVAIGMVQSMGVAVKGDKADDARALLKYQMAQLTTFSTTPDGVLLTSVAATADGK